MKTLEITTDREPWVNGVPQALGAVVDVDDETADAMVGHGFARIVAATKPQQEPQPEPQPEPAPVRRRRAEG